MSPSAVSSSAPVRATGIPWLFAIAMLVGVPAFVAAVSHAGSLLRQAVAGR